MQQQQQQSATVVNIAGQPTNFQCVIATQPPRPTVYPNFPKKLVVAVSISLIVAGSLSIIFNIVEIAVGAIEVNQGYYYNLTFFYGFIGHGIWVGILCIIPGGIGIVAGIHKTRGLIGAFNYMCVIAALASASQFGIGVAGAIAGPICYYDCDDVEDTAIAMEALLAILAVVEASAAIFGSVLCCRTYCLCCETTPEPSAMHYGTHVMVIAGNQQNPTVHYPVTIQGYRNMAYQPGYNDHQPEYHDQPVQYNFRPAYSVQDQFVPDQLPPSYPGVNSYI